jgi:Rps23 Pro-64 3,4-dihydroxylase Tpa1-like proline 4-hydroxylase
MKHFNAEILLNLGTEKHQEYINASPFPHIILDNLFDLDTLRNISAEFPRMQEKMRGKANKTTLNKLSFRQPEKLELFEPLTAEFSRELNSLEFCKFLENLTGIESIQSDPYFEGGGPHEIKKGGFLKMHVDFNIHPITNQDRRINVLIYLNENWKEEYKGQLDLWDTEMGDLKKSVLPIINRVVIFNTTENSWHGHPDPLACPETMSRKSLAFYYYTDPEPGQSRSGHSTIYKKRHNSDF